ncbi:DNA-binding protein, partial [Streptomyces xiamenensis]
MSTTSPSPHLTVEELAERWRTTPKAIYGLRHRRRTPPAIKRGRILLFPLAAVEAHEAADLAADAQMPVELRPAEPKRSARRTKRA